MSLQVMDFVRSKNGVGLALYVDKNTVYVWTAEHSRKPFRLDQLEVVSRDHVTSSELLVFHDADGTGLQGIPDELHAEIRRRWYMEVLKSRDQGVGQKRLSEFLGGNGIRKGDPRWHRVIDRGYELYYM